MFEEVNYGISYEQYIDDLMEIPDASFRASGNFYHYTSFENCIKMLEHTDMVFEMWASHILYLNDTEEHKNGLKLIDRKVEDLLLSRGDALCDWTEQYLEKRSQSYSDEIYVICFCSERNLLSQWKYYGKNSGVAIEYNLNKCEYAGFFPEFPNMYLKQYIRKAVYDDMEKQGIVDEFIKKRIYSIYENTSKSEIEKRRETKEELDKLYKLAPLFKHNFFKEEHESRLLFMPTYKEKAESAKKAICYRTSDGKIIPYMRIKIRGQEEAGERLPVIKSLTVGPGRNQDLIFDALKHFIVHKFPQGEVQDSVKNRKDYSYIRVNGIEIRKSTMPFRD